MKCWLNTTKQPRSSLSSVSHNLLENADVGFGRLKSAWAKEKGVGLQFFKIKTKIQPGAHFKSHFPSFKYLKLSSLFRTQDVGRALVSLTLLLPRPAFSPEGFQKGSTMLSLRAPSLCTQPSRRKYGKIPDPQGSLRFFFPFFLLV